MLQSLPKEVPITSIAGKMHWIVDEVPDQFLLNTARWKFILPNLYKQYPNDNMTLNISISSVPNIEIKEQQIDATVTADVIINVLNDTEAVPVACISVVRLRFKSTVSSNKFAKI
nr:putative BPI/LBP family protein At1g04970 [Ipomoea batatas]